MIGLFLKMENPTRKVKGDKVIKDGTPYSESVKNWASPLGEPFWMQAIRQKAYSRFQETGFPVAQSEAWRRESLKPVLEHSFSFVSPHHPTSADWQRIEEKFISKGEKARVVFINGCDSGYGPSLPQWVKGAVVSDFQRAVQDQENLLRDTFAKGVEKETNPFASINTFQFQNGVFVYVPKGFEMDESIHLVFAGMPGENFHPVFYPRVLLVLDEGAKANLMLSHVGLSSGWSLMNSVAEVYLKKNARANVEAVHRGLDGNYQLCKLSAYLGEGSHLEMNSFLEGGALTRNELAVHFEGEGAKCFLRGLSILTGSSKTGSHLLIHHQVPHCESRQLYKNILDEQAEAEFDSLVYVGRGAKGSDSKQMNRNLLLSDKARAFSRPQLRIDFDDVQAVHGSTTGQLDEQALFYLQSRGLSLPEARFALTYGMAEEVLQEIHPPAFREQLERFVREKLKNWFECT